jgi:hypothetical protein
MKMRQPQLARLPYNEVDRKETRVLVEKAGIPVTALVSTEDLKRLTQLDEQDQRARDVLEAMRALPRRPATSRAGPRLPGCDRARFQVSGPQRRASRADRALAAPGV